MNQSLKGGLFVVAGFILLTVAVFSLYISGWALKHSFGASEPQGDKLYALLTDPESKGVFEGVLRAENPTPLISPTGQQCFIYQTAVIKWETFRGSGSNSSTSTDSELVFEECGEAHKPYLDISQGRIRLDVADLDSSYLETKESSAEQVPGFIGLRRTGVRESFTAPKNTLSPNPRASSAHYEVQENTFQGGQKVTAVGQLDEQRWLRPHPELDEPVLLPGSRDEVVKLTQKARGTARMMALKYFALAIVCFFGVWVLHRHSRRQ